MPAEGGDTTGMAHTDESSSDTFAPPFGMEIEGDGTFDATAVGGETPRVFMLRNVSEASVDLAAVAITTSSELFPMQMTTCDGMLLAGEACEIHVVYAPLGLGFHHAQLHINVGEVGGMFTRDLAGTATGQTPNLLNNGDAELGGSPPVGWSVVNGGWTTTGEGVVSGAVAIFAGTVGAPSVVRLMQSISLEAFEPLVASGFLMANFSGLARSHEPGDDDYAIGIEFYDVERNLIDSVSTGFESRTSWTSVDGSPEPVPVNARSVAFVLMCDKRGGGMQCNAYFDDLVLALSFNPS